MGDRLRKSLDHADMSVAEMAEYLEVSRNTVGNYMAGKTQPPGAVLKLWAMRTGVPRQWLEIGKTPDQPEPDGGLTMRTRRYSKPQPSDPKVRVSSAGDRTLADAA